MLRLILGLAALILPMAPAHSEYLPQPEEIALPSERALLTETLSRLIADPDAEPGKVLTALDHALGRLGEPTRLRGFIQFARAGLLQGLDREVEAREAVEESIRLLPGYSGPLLRGAMFYAYSDQSARAADYLIRASRIDPDLVRQIDDYEINNILGRLGRDQRRVAQLSERLLEIGWLGESLASRSRLAVGAIDARVVQGDLAGAKRLVPKLLLPGDSMRLLVQNKYQGLWPEIERWAGTKLEKQWPIYFREAREKWEATRDPAHATEYVAALNAAGHDDTIIRVMLPLFSGALDREKDYDLMLVTIWLGEALARKGRWDDIEAMFANASKAWPMGSDANALNISGNRARYLLYAGKTAEALAAIDATIADSKRWKDEINESAIGAMHHYRACMLHKLGRSQEAATSIATANERQRAVARAQLYLCLEQHDNARETLVQALGSEQDREEVLLFMQRTNPRTMQSEYGRVMGARNEALRTDPKLLQEALKYGRILPFTLSEGAPPELASAKPL
ncbi:MAG TPA: hypothetical protein VGR19_12125 [Allosphingosinicella sp.]|nr:hypothetical protein [Allosphingosinicella sp.]